MQTKFYIVLHSIYQPIDSPIVTRRKMNENYTMMLFLQDGFVLLTFIWLFFCSPFPKSYMGSLILWFHLVIHNLLVKSQTLLVHLWLYLKNNFYLSFKLIGFFLALFHFLYLILNQEIKIPMQFYFGRDTQPSKVYWINV